MTITVKLPSEFEKVFSEVLKKTPEKGVKELMIKELKRLLAEYRLIDERLKEKYGVGFEEFRKKDVLREKGRSFEVEEDYCDWELAVDGIASIKKKIEKLEKLA